MNTTFRSFFGRLLVLFAVLLAFAADADAQARRPVPPPPVQVAAGKVQVKLLVVAATDTHEGVDPQLQSLARHLTYLRYKGYDLINSHSAELDEGAHATFSVEGGRRVTVYLLKKAPEKAQFRVEMFNQAGKLLDTTLSVNRNGTFIVAGPKYKDGILILPLQAAY